MPDPAPVTPKKHRVLPPSPPSSSRKVVQALGKLASAGAGMYGGALAETVTQAGFDGFDHLMSDRHRGNSKVSNMNGQMSGKMMGRGLRVSRKKTVMSPYWFAQKGVSVREEFRIQDDTAGTNESRFVGHISMPLNTVYYSLWYAILKQLFVKAGAYVGSLTEVSQNVTTSSSIVVNYYTSWLSTNALSKAYTPGSNLTWKALFDGFANWMLTQFEEDPREIRIVDIEYLGATAFSRTDYNRVRLNFPQIKIHVKTKSMLKIQNQSSFGGSGSEDDVTNIPVELHTYYVKGNQFINQNLKKSYEPGYGAFGFDETFAKNSVGAEAPPAYQILNCTGKDKSNLDPGHIKTSIISHSGVYRAQWLLSQCVTLVNTGSTLPRYWKIGGNLYNSLGHSRGIHIDRVIGSTGTGSGDKVRINTEMEFVIASAAICPINTATDQYETQN